VEQNANQALHIADRGYVIENGVITISDSAENLLHNQDIQKAYLGI
jgi:branched-chain amino acid transport system ATP-binding protein